MSGIIKSDAEELSFEDFKNNENGIFLVGYRPDANAWLF